jgi:hypothetical protein
MVARQRLAMWGLCSAYVTSSEPRPGGRGRSRLHIGGASALIQAAIVAICVVVRHARGLALVVEHPIGIRAPQPPKFVPMTLL